MTEPAPPRPTSDVRDRPPRRPSDVSDRPLRRLGGDAGDEGAELAFTLGVRSRLGLLLALVCVAGVGTAGWLHLEAHTRSIKQGLFEQARRTGEVLARSVTAMILRDQVSSIRELAEEALHIQENAQVAPVVYVTVADATGKILYDSQARGREVLAPEVARVLTANVRSRERLTEEVVPDQAGHPVRDVGVPCVVVGVDGKRRFYGQVRLGVRLDAVEERWLEALQDTAWAGLGAIVLGLLVGALASGAPVRFISSMLEVVNQIASGDFTQRIRSYRGDELGRLALAIDRMADDLQKRELLKRYISATAWDEIEERGIHQAEEQEVTLKEVTVLFLDIRNYTSLSEVYQSREIVAMLNEVFTILIGVVDDFGGVLDKFIGDALLVVFYPGAENDDAVRAVYAACRMQEALDDFNQRRRFYGRDAISIGVGINTGTVIAGSVGSQDRKDYTVIGDPVNVAARLQERSKQGQHTRVILSETTYDQVSSLVEVEELEGEAVRGKTTTIRAREVVRVKGLHSVLDSLYAADPKAQKEAFKALEATSGEEALPHLLNVLVSDQQDAVLKAIPILARVGSEHQPVAELLTSLVQEDQDPKVLATAIRALGNLRNHADPGRLKEFLIHEDARVRANTIEALDGLGSEEHLDAMAPLLHDPNQRVRANAAVALWKHGRRDVVRVLGKLAESDQEGERASAVFALGELFASEASPPVEGDSQAVLERIVEDLEPMRRMVEVLRGRLLDESPVVVEKAVHALAKARDTSVVLDLAQVAARAPGSVDPAMVVASMARVGTPPRVARLLREWRARQREEASG